MVKTVKARGRRNRGGFNASALRQNGTRSNDWALRDPLWLLRVFREILAQVNERLKQVCAFT